MIDIRHDRVEGFHVLSLQGHAQYDRHGQDIVCAGVSAVLYALLGWLANHVTDHHYSVAEPGDSLVVCQAGPDIDIAIEVTLLGLAQIAQRYPDNVTMTDTAPGGDAREQTARKEHGDHA